MWPFGIANSKEGEISDFSLSLVLGQKEIDKVFNKKHSIRWQLEKFYLIKQVLQTTAPESGILLGDVKDRILGISNRFFLTGR